MPKSTTTHITDGVKTRIDTYSTSDGGKLAVTSRVTGGNSFTGFNAHIVSETKTDKNGNSTTTTKKR